MPSRNKLPRTQGFPHEGAASSEAPPSARAPPVQAALFSDTWGGAGGEYPKLLPATGSSPSSMLFLPGLLMKVGGCN